MSKFSVKKPFTILVAVIALIALGIVSFGSISLDLLPQLSLPYLVVVTPYPGASPEKVEAEVSAPLESSLGTISNVKNVISVSAENYSMIQMEFASGTNMDSSMVKVSSAVNQVSASLPETVGTPSILELSMDMIATMYVAVEKDGYDIYELSEYARDELIPFVERQEGVASVNVIGLVEQTVQVELNKNKIDTLNRKIRAKAVGELFDAKEMLDDAQAEADDGQSELEEQESAFGDTLSEGIFSSVEGPVADLSADLSNRIVDLINQLNTLNETVSQLSDPANTITSAMEEAQDAVIKASEKVQLLLAERETAQEAYDDAVDALEKAGEAASPSLTEAVALTSDALAKAESDLDTARAELTKAQAAFEQASQAALSVVDTEALQTEITSAANSLNLALASLDGSSLSTLTNAVTTITGTLPQIQSIISSAYALDVPAVDVPTVDIEDTLLTLNGLVAQLPSLMDSAQEGFASLTQGQLDAAVGFSAAASAIQEAQTQLKAARTQYEAAKETVLKSANLDQLLNTQTLSSMIYAQNFSMPAGYIDDKDDNSWLLKIGDEYDDSEGISNILLVDLDGIGIVRLFDVADVTVIDNAGESYAKLNGEDGLVLSIYKSSTAGTNEVSKNVNASFKERMENDPELTIVSLMDQGDNILLILSDILRSILLGAALAILILAIFLRDVRPTILVAISIPLSVFFAIVLMYFTKLSLNIMTLSGLALGIGMLVDNSIVVIENIFRLRLRGFAAPRAAVQGTKQVAGAIIASTLTTICVFFPMVFTSGYVRELLVPMALSVTYCLVASLIVAMTVVPAGASTILKRMKPKESRVMKRIQNTYAKTLGFCLRHKILALAVAIALFILCAIRLFTMGIVLLPEMTAENIEVDIYTDEEDTREESYRKVDEVMDVLLNIEGVEAVGIMDEANTAGLVGGSFGNFDSFGGYLCYVMPDEEHRNQKEILSIVERIKKETGDLPLKITANAGGMSDLTSMLSSGLSLNIYGDDLDELKRISEDVMGLIKEVDGFTDVKNGLEETDRSLHLIIDKDKAMAAGFTVAQIYAEISQRLTTSVTSTTITLNGLELDVVIEDRTHALTRENLLDMEFEVPEEISTAMEGGMDLSAFADMETAFAGAESEEDADEEASGGSGTSGEEEKTGPAKEEKEEKQTVYQLRDFATLKETDSLRSVQRENLSRYLTVTAGAEEGRNVTLLSRELSEKLDSYEVPQGYRISIEGETSQVSDMILQMIKLAGLALLFIYLVMVAQFQSLLSPFIIMFTIPLAFTGGMLGLIVAREQLSMLSLMGFLILMGTVVNNGIVFVDYANQLRIGGLKRHDALIATGQTRMRPILMTALTTILAMLNLIFGGGSGAQMGRGMALVIAAGLLYATLMTLFIVPILYDVFFKRQPLSVDVGDDLDDLPDDAADYLANRNS